MKKPPTWVWIAGGGGVIIAYLYYQRSKASSSEEVVYSPVGEEVGAGGGGGGSTGEAGVASVAAQEAANRAKQIETEGRIAEEGINASREVELHRLSQEHSENEGQSFLHGLETFAAEQEALEHISRSKTAAPAKAAKKPAKAAKPKHKQKAAKHGTAAKHHRKEKKPVTHHAAKVTGSHTTGGGGGTVTAPKAHKVAHRRVKTHKRR